MLTGAYRSCPKPSIYNLACTPPFHILWRPKITLNRELKLSSTLPTLDSKPIFQILPTLLQKNNLDVSKVLINAPTLTPMEKCHRNQHWTFYYEKKDITSSIYKNEYFHIIQNITSEKCIQMLPKVKTELALQ